MATIALRGEPEQNEIIESSDSLSFEFDEQEAITAHLQRDNSTINYTSKRNQDNQHQVGVDVKKEIDIFNPDPLPPNTNVLEYWDKNKDHPLYDLAMIVFSVPPTEVQIERDFSTQDFMFTKRRGNICHSRLEDIFVIHLNNDLFYEVMRGDIAQLLRQLK